MNSLLANCGDIESGAKCYGVQHAPPTRLPTGGRRVSSSGPGSFCGAGSGGPATTSSPWNSAALWPAAVASATEALDAQISPRRSPRRKPPSSAAPPEPQAPSAPEPWQDGAHGGDTLTIAQMEVERLKRQLEEERARHFETSRRAMVMLEQLRDEQERADDFRAKLELRDVSVDVARVASGAKKKRAKGKLAALEDPAGYTGAEGLEPGPGEDMEQSYFLGAKEEEDEVDYHEGSGEGSEEEKDLAQKDPMATVGSGMDAVGSKRTMMNQWASELSVGGVKTERKCVLKHDELMMCFRGSITKQPRLKGVTKGGAPRGEGQEMQYAWILALSLPNPRQGHIAKLRPRGIGESEAGAVYEMCFRAEDIGGMGTAQAERFMREKALFLRAFAKLPPADGNAKARRFAGIESEDSLYWARDEVKEIVASGGELAHSFLELLRNAIVTKIGMHCQLPVRTCQTEDKASVLVLVTATEKDLLKEADRQAMPMELDVSVVDPISLEPCCPQTFYPLLDWYLKISPHAPVATVRHAYYRVLESLAEAPNQELLVHKAQVVFWAKHDTDSDSTPLSPNLARKSGRKSTFHSTMVSMMSGSSTEMDFDEQTRFMMNEADHTYRSHRWRKLLLEAFLRYLQLKAEGGLSSNPRHLIDQVNREFGKTILVNWHTAIGLHRLGAPFKAFKLDQYFTDKAQTVAKNWWRLYTCRARRADAIIRTPFNGQERAKLLENILDRQLDLAQLEAQGFITSIFPLDARDKIERTDDGHVGDPSGLITTWGLPDDASLIQKGMAFVRGMCMHVPLDEVRNYYGERIAFYFALVDMIRKWLVFPGIVGIIAYFVQVTVYYDPRTELAPRLRVISDLFYACFIAIWGTVMLERWKRREAVLAFHWGQRGIGQAEITRPRFIGILRRSPVTYADGEVYYSPWYRARWQALSVFLLVSLGTCEAIGTVFTGRLRGAWVRDQWPFHERAQMITAIIEDIQMTTCGKIGYIMSVWLNDRENYRTETQYINGLIAKVVCHELWNRFHLYFYVAFVKALREGCVMTVDGRQQLVEPEDMRGRMCYEEVGLQVTTVLCVEFAKNAIELFKPIFATHWTNRFRPTPEVLAVDEDRGVARMSHFCQIAMEKPLYGRSLEIDGTFDDYLEIMRLLGHFTLFSLVFPLAPAMGFFLLIVEVRVDGFKLFELVRRPLPRNAEDIGHWFYVLSAISWTSMFSNSGLVVFTLGAFDSPPGYFGDLPRWVYFVFLSGALCLFKTGAMLLIDDCPWRIRIAEAHHEWVRDRVDEFDKPHDDKPLGVEEVDVGALDLTVDDANAGQFRDPGDFGITVDRILRRMKSIKRRNTKTKTQGGQSKSIRNFLHSSSSNAETQRP